MKGEKLQAKGKLIMKVIALLCSIVLGSTNLRAQTFPESEKRGKLFDKFISEIERLDGDGLLPRKNRPDNWKSTIKKLRAKMTKAHNWQEVGHIFKQIDATYPNLHAKVTLAPFLDPVQTDGRPTINARFAPISIKKGQESFVYEIAKVNTDNFAKTPAVNIPQPGNRLLAINGRTMAEWGRENFVYCKFPLREQCEANFFDHFRKELLSWNRTQKLTFKLKRGARTWSVAIPVTAGDKPSSHHPSEDLECGVEKGRYPNFETVYKGLNICVFSKKDTPDQAVLRINSFRYRGIPKESVIQTIDDEVEGFWKGYWAANNSRVKLLIIDLIENGGGDTPTEWYRIFYPTPFQEQFVQFRKISELENPDLQSAMFYDSNARKIWFDGIRKSGVYANTKPGAFLPEHPMFCASEEKNCIEGLFAPREHKFVGEVRLLVDEWCISTCVGFVWSMKRQLKERA